jgi:hypothetical protein
MCIKTEHPTMHRHITGIGTGNDRDQAADIWTVSDVRAAISAGHRFYTYADGATAMVESYNCRCGYSTIRSAADSTLFNNLDRLRECT